MQTISQHDLGFLEPLAVQQLDGLQSNPSIALHVYTLSVIQYPQRSAQK